MNETRRSYRIRAPPPLSQKNNFPPRRPTERAYTSTLPIANPVVSAGGQHLSEDVHEEKTKNVASAADGREIRRVNVFRHVSRRPRLGHSVGFRRGRGRSLLRDAVASARVPWTVTALAPFRRRRRRRCLVRAFAVRLAGRSVLVRDDLRRSRRRRFLRGPEKSRKVDAGGLQFLVTTFGRYSGLKTSSGRRKTARVAQSWSRATAGVYAALVRPLRHLPGIGSIVG